MAKFISRFPELSFYVGDERKQFVAGEFKTEDAETIKVLESIKEVRQAKEPKAEEKPKQAEASEAKPKPTPTKRKSTAK